MIRKHFASIVSLLIVANLCFGQKAPIKYGEVDLADLQMTSYPEDTTARAVILCDYGIFDPSSFLFTRILRIKILKKEGYDWANNIYPTNTKSMLKGVTSNLENGEVVQDKLKNESIFTERVSENQYRMRVAMPKVKVGSVLDLQFTFQGIPMIWKFQETIPERYNELVMPQSKFIRFKSNFFGYIPIFSSTPSRWVAKNMPSFKVEPYLNSERNYITKLEFDVLDLSIGNNFITVTTSWDDLFSGLKLSKNFGIAIAGSAYLNELARKIDATGKSKLDKLKMAYDTIKNEVKWDELNSFFTSSPNLGYIYKMKLGNSADINLMLAQLLRKLDIEVIEVALSTRDNGILSPLSPSLQKLNYVIARAKIDDQIYMLDATEPFMPYYLLPLRCLNYQGRTVKEDQGEWVDIKTDKKDKKVVFYDLELQDDNNLTGKLTILSSDYAAYDFRKKYSTFNSRDEYLDDFKKDKSGLSISMAKLENIDSIYLPVNESYDININNKISNIGDEIYILPMFFDQMTENPFKMDVRNYPIDFGYNKDNTVISTIIIPENYSIKELPATVNLKLPGNDASYLFEVTKVGSNIKMTSRFTINKALFLENEYFNLKEFYNQMIKKQNEPIILKKN